MEIRKLIRIGERSFGVTLPREWVESNQLKVGSPIKILTEANKILILPATAEGVAVAVSLKEEDVEKALRDVIAYYIEGVDEISIESGNISALVGKVEGRLPGVVALESGGKLKLRIVTKEDVDIDEVVTSTRWLEACTQPSWPCSTYFWTSSRDMTRRTPESCFAWTTSWTASTSCP
ncbi:MAG: AbrB/MazE/SpoVT family DNA-binding domain-containing protein [Thermoproteus sp.]